MADGLVPLSVGEIRQGMVLTVLESATRKEPIFSGIAAEGGQDYRKYEEYAFLRGRCLLVVSVSIPYVKVRLGAMGRDGSSDMVIDMRGAWLAQWPKAMWVDRDRKWLEVEPLYSAKKER